jgi:L-seryl-tRNA(Ser) seleniumtransferase
VTEPRIIPSIEQLRRRPAIRALEQTYGSDATLAALRAEAETLRVRLTGGGAGGTSARTPAEAADRLERAVAERLERDLAPSLTRVINATGVIVHTNLGRAPLAPAATARVAALAGGYSNLEYDLAAGRRGVRDVHAERLLRQLTGAEAAVVVNNNAAATLLMLAALAAGREVVVSRGELVEIGGGFRVPDVMAQSGAVLREVGTTNRTRAADYAAAIGDRTALILRVHPSNFRIEGFTERPGLAELVDLGRELGVPVVEDLGSGNLLAAGPAEAGPYRGPAAAEPAVGDSIRAGAGVVCFSGDKMLGGPQAGILVGAAASLDRIRRHSLMRALRVDKMTYAALEATLIEYARGRAAETVPVCRMIALAPDAIDARARRIAGRLADRRGLGVKILDGVSTIGGGSAPGSALPTRLLALALDGTSADALEARLRSLTPPLIARIEQETVVLDLRTVAPDEDEELAALLLGLTSPQG